VQSKAYMSQINLQHRTTNDRGEQEKWKTKEENHICSEVSVIRGVSPVEEKVGYGGKDLQKKSFKPGVKE